MADSKPIPSKFDELGRVEGKWHALDLTAQWLANRLTHRASGQTVQVLFRPDGAVAFVYRGPAGSIPIYLAVGRTAASGLQTRFGALLAPPRISPASATHLLTHTSEVLNKAFPQSPPLWLQRRNQNVASISWGPECLEVLFGDLLVPGLTRWGSTLLESAAFDDSDQLILACSGDPGFEIRISPASVHGTNTSLGRYGPLNLNLTDPAHAKNPLANYIGYLLALGMPETASLARSPEDSTDWRIDPSDDMDVDCFFSAHYARCRGKFSAVCAAKGSSAIIVNMARDCAFSGDWMTGPTEETRFSPWSIFASPNAFRTFRFTDPSDIDLISAGVEPRMTELVRRVADTGLDIMLVQAGCTGQLIGDDVFRSVADGTRGDTKPVLTMALESCVDRGDDYIWFWDSLLEQRTRPTPLRPKALNLVGYGKQESNMMRELVALTHAVGVQEVQCLIPSFDFDRLPDFPSAGLTLVYPSDHVQEAFSRARRHCAGKTLSIPAPWGLDGSLAWLTTLLGGLGLPTDESLFTRLLQEALPPNWIELKRRAAQHRVAIVASASYLRKPDAELRHGAPLPRILHELGFGIDLAVLPAAQARPPRLSDSLLRRWGITPDGTSPHRLVLAHHAETLEEFLARLDVDLIYSEWECDARILDAGRTPFSVSDLDMGLFGAVRNMNRLLGLAGLPFSKHYRRAKTEAIHA